MLFNSFHFAIFLPIVFAIYWLSPSRFRWIILLLASYYFYMSWNAKYVVLIFTTTFVAYLTSIFIDKTDDKQKKKSYLIMALFVCLGILFIFKYLNFFFDSLNAVFALFSIKLHPFTSKLLLPVGISFYTFQTLSYVIDVYRGKISAEKNLGIFATYVSFFPQLVAGPIERSTDLLPQIKSEHTFDYKQGTYGLKLMAWGFFKKMVVADNIAYYVDLVYNNVYDYSGFVFIFITVLFSIQIYCDFSGYSDIAKGVAKLFGIRLSDNFRSPYFATNIKEFWSKWHISLSTWFKDYVYIPLGGNRCSKLRHSINLIITFLVSGIWHGANWTFVIWGMIHGVGQVFENILNIQAVKKIGSFKWWLKVVLTFVFVTFTWVFFRAQNFQELNYIFMNMFDGISSPINYVMNGIQATGMNINQLIECLVFASLLLVNDYFSLRYDVIEVISKQKWYVRYPVYYLIVMIVIFFHAIGEVSFVYFQF